jgi:5-methylcytosine-specific restriction endonuclease McrA
MRGAAWAILAPFPSGGSAAAYADPNPQPNGAGVDVTDDVEDALFAPEPLTDPTSARVLILNASFEPLHVCSVKRAVGLLMHDIAERVEDAETVLRTPNSVFAVPSVVRLKRYVKRPHRQRVAFNRRNVFRRDDHACQYCSRRGNDLTLDHVLPRSRGGPTSWENVVACCRGCNAKKRDRTPDEARMQLGRKPYAPRFMFTSAYGLLPDIDPAWKKYLPELRSEEPTPSH